MQKRPHADGLVHAGDAAGECAAFDGPGAAAGAGTGGVDSRPWGEDDAGGDNERSAPETPRVQILAGEAALEVIRDLGAEFARQLDDGDSADASDESRVAWELREHILFEGGEGGGVENFVVILGEHEASDSRRTRLRVHHPRPPAG